MAQKRRTIKSSIELEMLAYQMGCLVGKTAALFRCRKEGDEMEMVMGLAWGG